MESEKKNIGKKYFDPNFKPDIVPQQRQRVIDNFHLNFFPHLEQYYQSKRSEIKKYFPETDQKIQELIKEKDLKNEGIIESDIYNEIWDLIEHCGQEFDQFGMLKERKDFDKEIENIKSFYESNYKYTNWNLIFNLHKELYYDGSINICIGGMGEGKSNLMIALALGVAENSNKYEIITNFKLLNMDQYDDIHFVSYMSELLKIGCINAISNYELKAKGKKHLCKTMIVIIDEGENFIQSQRTTKELLDFNKILNMYRKIFISLTLVFHRYDDIPRLIRKNPSLTSIMYKNTDKEGDSIGLNLDEVIISLEKSDQLLYIRNIPRIKQLDSDHTSNFTITSKSQPQLSCDIEELIEIASRYDGIEAPREILKELEKVKIEHIPDKDIIKDISRITRTNIDKLIFCKNKIDFLNIIIKQVENYYKLDDIDIIKGLQKKVNNIVSKEWSTIKINKEIEKAFKLDQENINFTNFDYITEDKIKVIEFLKHFKYSELKDIIIEKRLYNKDELLYFYSKGISKSKFKLIYGESNEILELLKEIENL